MIERVARDKALINAGELLGGCMRLPATLAPKTVSVGIDPPYYRFRINRSRHGLVHTERKCLSQHPLRFTSVFWQKRTCFIERNRPQIALAALKQERGTCIVR